MDHYLYLDQTGPVDCDIDGAGLYFVLSTIHFAADSRYALWEGLAVRLELEAAGVALPQGGFMPSMTPIALESKFAV